MVKLIGPMMSISASGKFADTMVFARKGGTAYARQRVVPFNPKSAAQTGNRALMSFLTKAWAGISANDKATWQALADSMSGQPFNAYIASNMSQWKNFITPNQYYPGTAAGDAGTLSSPAVTGQVGQVLVGGAIGTANDNWGIMIFRSPDNGFTPSPNNLVHMIEKTDTGVFEYIDSPLQPGTWYYKLQTFSIDQTKGTASSQLTATVT